MLQLELEVIVFLVVHDFVPYVFASYEATNRISKLSETLSFSKFLVIKCDQII